MSERMKDVVVSLGGAAVAILIVLSGPLAASAQEMPAGAWLPWVGCWESMDARPGEAPGDPAMLCVRPAGEGLSVELMTVVDGAVRDREVLQAEAGVQEVAREGCTGTREARFSTDRRRVYLESDYVCDGDVERASTGLMAMLSPAEWIDIEVVDVGGRDMAWVQRYRRASPERVRDAGLEDLVDERSMAVRTARYRASAPADVEAVIETSAEVHPEAVKAWLAEQNDPMELDADALVRMADAGVEPEVIDVAVALSFPERFALSAEGDAAPMAADRQGYDRYYEPYYGPYSRRYYGYDPFYGPRGFGGFGYYGGYTPRVIVVQPVGRETSGGRMVNGRGYVPGSGTSSGSARPRGSSGSSSPTGVAPRRSTSGGSSGATSTGRKAKKKGGGGEGGDALELRW